MPPVVFAIYADSFLFVFATAILQFSFGVDYSLSACQSAILICLVCYVTTKVCPVCLGLGREIIETQLTLCIMTDRGCSYLIPVLCVGLELTVWQLIYLFLVEKAVGYLYTSTFRGITG